MKSSFWIVMAVTASLLLGQTALGAVLIGDSFDYNTGALAGNSGGTGWADAWTTAFSTATGSIDVTSGSIAFSDYATTGNKVTLDFQTAPAFTSIWALRTVGQSVGSGDMWYSFLYQRQDTAGITTSRTAEVRFNDGVIHFGSQVKASSSQGIRVRYEGSTGASAAATSIQDGNAYLAISKFENLNNVGSQATFWVLDAAGYDSIKAGGLTEAELNATAVLIATDATSTTEVLTANLDKIELVNATSSYPFTFDLDEIRLGTSLADVIPEPVTAGWLAAGITLLFIRRR
ncbi:MAG: hypothetical protein IT445_03905 [Phycisphaeraceae bacterium]|nr:hypothetical protein [Phycisphaeraceae bacterium]